MPEGVIVVRAETVEVLKGLEDLVKVLERDGAGCAGRSDERAETRRAKDGHAGVACDGSTAGGEGEVGRRVPPQHGGREEEQEGGRERLKKNESGGSRKARLYKDTLTHGPRRSTPRGSAFLLQGRRFPDAATPADG